MMASKKSHNINLPRRHGNHGMVKITVLLCLVLGTGLIGLGSSAAWADGQADRPGGFIRLLGPDGQPPGRVRVQIVGGRDVVSDERSLVSLSPWPDTPFQIVVFQQDGAVFQPVTIIAPPAETPLEIRLELVLDQELTVAAQVPAEPDLPPASAATRIGGTELRHRQPDTLAMAMENIPGSSTARGDLSAVPSLRGLPKNRTLILLDQGRVGSERRAGPSASFLDPETLSGIEVIRGPGTVAYGSDAFGGVIRVSSRQAPLDPSASLRYGLFGSVGSDAVGAVADSVLPLGTGGLLLGGQCRRYMDYCSPEGTIDNSAGREAGFRAGYQAAWGGGLLECNWRSDFARDVGKPAADSAVTRAFYPEEDSHRLGVRFDRPGPGGWERISVSGLWDYYRLETGRDQLPSEDVRRQLTLAVAEAQDYELRATAERPLGPVRLLLGVHGFGRYGLSAVNETTVFDSDGQPVEVVEELSIDSASRRDWGAFAGLGGQSGRLHWSGALRGDWLTASNRGGYFGDRRVSHGAVSGFLAGGIRVLPGLTVDGQVSRGFRDPMLSDRYYRGISGRGFITGNPDLEPETSRQLDLALRYEEGPLRLAAYGYLYRIRHLVERYRQGKDYYFRNRGEAEVRGLELEGECRLAEGLAVLFGGHYLRGRVLDDDSPTDDIPAPGVFLALRGMFHQGRFWWTLRGTGFDRDARPGPSEKIVPGAILFDAAAGWKLNDRLQLQIGLKNMLDQPFFASADEKSVLAPGCSIQCTLRGEF